MLKETMEHVYELPVKLSVDVSTGKNWGELWPWKLSICLTYCLWLYLFDKTR
jgi:hypothetical protein